VTYQVIIPKPVARQLDRLPKSVRDSVLTKLTQLKETPRPKGCAKLRGYENEYRIRIGDYRIRYEIDDKSLLVVILHRAHRKEVYRR
jgi:mRNA interferase RelE/StbE